MEFIKQEDMITKSARRDDFITVRTIKDDSGEEVHDYTAQLG